MKITFYILLFIYLGLWVWALTYKKGEEITIKYNSKYFKCQEMK